MKMNEEKIKNLWNWFFSNEQKIRDCIENGSSSEQDFITQNLDNLILDLGVFSWEIGPGIDNHWVLTISPNGDKDLLKKSKKIVDSAPAIVNWEFNYCKPAKDWDRKFTIYDNYFSEQEINASNWKYVVIHSKEGMIDLILEAKNIGHLDRESWDTAANLVVVNEIGEELKIQNICSVDIVDQLGPEHESQMTDIIYLKKYINEISS